VPQLSSGDEIGRTQGGRADWYTLEPERWGLAWAEADWDLAAWVAEAAALRRECAVLRRDEWVPAHDPRIHWYDGDGAPMDDEAWHSPTVATNDADAGAEARPEWPPALQVAFRPDPERGERGPAVLLVVVSGGGERDVSLPEGEWSVRLDASVARGGEGRRSGSVTVTGPTLLALTGDSPVGSAPG
jgi:glycogen operon protein